MFVVERGFLESQARLLVASLRRWGGAVGENLLLTAFSPRKAHRPSPRTLTFLEAAGAEVSLDDLNVRFANYPIGNKVVACAWAEAQWPDDRLIFVDTDTMFLAEPTLLIANDPERVGVRPVDNPGPAMRDPDGPEAAYWSRVFEVCDCEPPPTVVTTVSGEQIGGYWNAGLIVKPARLPLFQRWYENMERLQAASLQPAVNAGRGLDQIALAAALAAFPQSIGHLPPTYNYPLPQRRKVLNPETLAVDLLDVVHLHYHRWLHKRDWLDVILGDHERGDPRFQWLQEQLPLTPTIEDPFPHG